MTAHELVNSGKKVLMVERGDWVKRGDHNWATDGSIDLTPFYSHEIAYKIVAGGNSPTMGAYTCVGGPSVFYGGVSMRLREADFEQAPEIVGNSGAEWPFSYADLEPFYCEAENLIGIAGDALGDPTEPVRTRPYPLKLNTLSETSKLVQKAAGSLGYKPFRLPLAINFVKTDDQAECIACPTCDTFACAISAKNDLPTRVLPKLLDQGLRLDANTIATRLTANGSRITEVTCYDKKTEQFIKHRARVVVLAAGALASPHLLLASELQTKNPGGDCVGRYLTRHCNAIAFGFFPKQPGNVKEFHKQLGIHDFYFGHASIDQPSGKLGSIQQLQTPPIGLVHEMVPRPVNKLVGLGVPHLTGLLVMAEDQPLHGNGLSIDKSGIDRFGLPQLSVTHRYTERDYAARDALLQKAKEILKEAGAWFCYLHKIKTFSHAVGTVRMGNDPETSALDEFCNFRGIDNLYVVDGSFMPTSGGLNPSLTIAANALRVGKHLAQHKQL
jgi:choline dehydrogenase-like flavoprotein